MTNHEKARNYVKKSKILGKSVMRFDYMPDDNVRLVGVEDNGETGKLVIPDFVTSIKKCGFETSSESVLYECGFTEIQVNNEREFDASNLCAGMSSREIYINFKHPELVTNISGLFFECERLKSVQICSGIGARLFGARSIFKSCFSLKEISIGEIDTSKVENLREVFCNCLDLEKIDLKWLSTKSAKDMRSLFENCEKICELDISSFDMSNVVDTSDMFSGCTRLTDINIKRDSIRNLGYTRNMFYECGRLVSIDLSNIEGEMKDIRGMFTRCRSIMKIDVSNMKITEDTKADFFVAFDRNLKWLDVSNLCMRDKHKVGMLLSGCLNKKIKVKDRETREIVKQVMESKFNKSDVWTMNNGRKIDGL